jgi:hypothetical protein
VAAQIALREWRWAALVAALVIALTVAPYVVAYNAQTESWRFSGFLVAVDDANSYIAKMGQGARGAWLFRLPYSSEPQSGVFVYGFYLLLGKLAGPEHGAQVFAYHAARVVFGFLFLLTTFYFLSFFLSHFSQRLLALSLVALGGGLGWLIAPLNVGLPVEFYSPEAFSFLMLFALPHLVAARCLLLLGLLAYLRDRPVWAGLALFGVALIQPLYVLAAWLVIGTDAMVGAIGERGKEGEWGKRLWEAARPVAVIVLVSAPVVVYTALAFALDPVMRVWSAQNVLVSAHPLHYLAGYGVLLALAVPGWRVLRRERPRLARFVLVWALLVPLMLYAPVATQRRFIEGFYVALVAVAVLGLTVALARWRRVLIPLTLAVSLPSTAVLLAGAWGGAQQLRPPIFLPADQLAVFDWLRANAPPDAVGLSAFETGNALPAYTPLVAYIGHGPETVRAGEKLAQVARFYRADTPEAERLQLLAEGRIAYVLWGLPERTLGDFDPATAAYLRLAFRSGEYAVYEVLRPLNLGISTLTTPKMTFLG